MLCTSYPYPAKLPFPRCLDWLILPLSREDLRSNPCDLASSYSHTDGQFPTPSLAPVLSPAPPPPPRPPSLPTYSTPPFPPDRLSDSKSETLIQHSAHVSWILLKSHFHFTSSLLASTPTTTTPLHPRHPSPTHATIRRKHRPPPLPLTLSIQVPQPSSPHPFWVPVTIFKVPPPCAQTCTSPCTYFIQPSQGRLHKDLDSLSSKHRFTFTTSRSCRCDDPLLASLTYVFFFCSSDPALVT